jgi:hypothetical protein
MYAVLKFFNLLALNPSILFALTLALSHWEREEKSEAIFRVRVTHNHKLFYNDGEPSRHGRFK